MIRSTQIARLSDGMSPCFVYYEHVANYTYTLTPGLMLCASVDDEQSASALAEVKSQVKLILRRLNRNSEQQASLESGSYTLQYVPTYEEEEEEE